MAIKTPNPEAAATLPTANPTANAVETIAVTSPTARSSGARQSANDAVPASDDLERSRDSRSYEQRDKADRFDQVGDDLDCVARGKVASGEHVLEMDDGSTQSEHGDSDDGCLPETVPTAGGSRPRMPSARFEKAISS